jgi:hypothetical protein
VRRTLQQHKVLWGERRWLTGALRHSRFKCRRKQKAHSPRKVGLFGVSWKPRQRLFDGEVGQRDRRHGAAQLHDHEDVVEAVKVRRSEFGWLKFVWLPTLR